MKKFFIVLCVIVLVGLTFLAGFSLTAYSYSKADLEAAQEKGYSQGYTAGYKQGRKEGYAEGYMALKPVSRPKSGTILSGAEVSGSEITVTASSTEDYVVQLKTFNDLDCVSFYVRAGDTVTISVPRAYLSVYFACGTEWYGYGPGLMFGEDTVYSKDDEALDFTDSSWEYTLYPVTGGNFTETPSNESDFFS